MSEKTLEKTLSLSIILVVVAFIIPVTDSEGKATKIITLSVPGTYDFRAEFEGDETYAGSSDEVSSESISETRFVANQLISKVEGASIKHVAKDFPEIIIKEGKAEELRSKFS